MSTVYTVNGKYLALELGNISDIDKIELTILD